MNAMRPKARYATTLDARLFPVVRRFLGTSLFDWGIRVRLRMEGRTPPGKKGAD